MGRHENNRTPYKFEDSTKHEARERAGGRCEWCGKEVPKLEAHHLIAIHIAREVPCLATEVIKSLANLVLLCSDCHSKFHDSAPETLEKYIEYAPIVLKKYLEMQLHGVKPEPTERQYESRKRSKPYHR